MTPAFRPAADVGVTVSRDGATVFVARLPAGPILVLDGAGAIIWAEATEGPGDGWIDRVADAFDVPASGIAADALAFVHALCGDGLLDEADAPRAT
ncbi:coenzyme PQQ synthesis protein D (PqqD) [Humibacillus xanthopallidus]|uniref:Coenzyme PQQ synthesis protein D (PqqD) n=1 Tax=Humibacillus xanthopallidus TaxID=412689 RepID=A0A543PXH1_9MICO|nr:PqqD family protein [Humibacillus xanthopallidus]TQN48766.1 coenzyme PQQ synthesis protein D (PqqD) [Humibacillus xanthopallidus]